MVLMLAKEQPKAIKTEGPGWLASTGDQAGAAIAGVLAERNEPS